MLMYIVQQVGLYSAQKHLDTRPAHVQQTGLYSDQIHLDTRLAQILMYNSILLVIYCRYQIYSKI